MNEERFLRIQQVKEITGLSRSSIYSKIRNNQFPEPVKISERCIAFVSSEISNWISEKIQESRQIN